MKHIAPWLPALVLASGAAQAAADNRHIPPPGLYEFQIVTDRKASSPAGSVAVRTDGDSATGTERAQYRTSDGRTAMSSATGAPTNICIPATKPGAIPPQLLAAGCVGKPGILQGDRMVFHTSCSGIQTTTTMRQIDSRTWESTVKVVQTGMPSAADQKAGMAFLRAAAENAARNGTPEERRQAQEMLAGFKNHEKDMAQAMKNMPPMPQMPPGAGGGMDIESVTRMTRIADRCK
jgi:hypothetical protein